MKGEWNMKFIRNALLSLVVLGLAAPAMAADLPGEGVTVRPARATWNTGYFQEAVVRLGLEELGYKVQKPTELQNPLFYQSLVLGDVDYWANGWFPLHNDQLPRNFAEKADMYGYIAKNGGLQGYLVSKKHVEEFGIESLDDFKRPEVMKAFDANDDGKADLVACPPGWGCEKVITHHMEVYDLGDYINPIKASYSASIAEALARYNSGDPVFFYTWAPNWTIFKFKPGEDVMWINVPEIKPTEGQAENKDAMTATGIVGAVSDPIELGFVVNDIRIVANKEFVGKNPAAEKFFELLEIPLLAINEQNTRMEEGEDSQKEVDGHAREWIEKNREKWDAWMAEAKAAAK
jgi:glycine betaine/proline transport system substrate-binding protein